ncbi:hypothetical protein BC939DRAFT_515383 [Gamsiella multidivaricata]|uniref:uncharacterized protein n=1 Tax=Gamsiella multidivaricata TaxID=101098 RepID=UPI00221FA772|nr:uncharacterized protein BC939DRAFT_515383 [Gamsiella multidivaricata]KAI7824755.1 hypothetical protein BC939DRAFT_515383 [Gamsiella multidivaricata]
MPGSFPLTLYTMSSSRSHHLQQQPQQQTSRQPAASMYSYDTVFSGASLSSPVFPISSSSPSALNSSLLQIQHHLESQERSHLYETAPDVHEERQNSSECPRTPLFHHPTQPYYGNHPLNRISFQQHFFPEPYHSPFANNYLQQQSKLKLASDQQEQQQPLPLQYHRSIQLTQEKSVVLSHPKLTRPWKTYTEAPIIVDSCTNKAGTASGLVRDPALPTHDLSPLDLSEEMSIKEKSSFYEALLDQIAAQRVKTNALDAGVQMLLENIAVLNMVLDGKQSSVDTALQDTQRAVRGWQYTWEDYSRCETIQMLQENPTTLAPLIQNIR